ncbi:HugZ family pyridoxamine 5'-phosphate oxidase, partial [Candidatus Entotheonella palauensis]
MSETPPTLSMAEQARTLVYQCSMGSLSTLSAKHPDWPFGSVIPYGLDAQGQPTFLISAMAMHTQNLQRDARASLLVTSDGDHAPLATARLTLMGTVAPVPGEVLEQVRSTYVLRHPEAAMWAEFSDFAFYGMAITDTYYVGGFGVMG